MIINLTKDTFQKEVLESDVPVLVDFWAPWLSLIHIYSPLYRRQEYLF